MDTTRAISSCDTSVSCGDVAGRGLGASGCVWCGLCAHRSAMVGESSMCVSMRMWVAVVNLRRCCSKPYSAPCSTLHSFSLCPLPPLKRTSHQLSRGVTATREGIVTPRFPLEDLFLQVLHLCLQRLHSCVCLLLLGGDCAQCSRQRQQLLLNLSQVPVGITYRGKDITITEGGWLWS